MNGHVHTMDNIVKGLEERAKELLCLYSTGEILRASDLSWDTKLDQLAQAIPAGWQYPEVCEARITFAGQTYDSPGFRETKWVMEDPVKIRDDEVGSIQVVYTEERPPADEGPFLKEERRLLRTLTRELGFQLAHEELANAWETWQSALSITEVGDGKKWKVIIDFLQRADPQLLQRISRKMLNHLRWKGAKGLESLHGYYRLPEDPDTPSEENKPMTLEAVGNRPLPTNVIFQHASESFSEEEILDLVQAWINRDKLSFLVNTLEWQESSLGDITDALSRFHALEMKEDELPLSVQSVIKAALLRRFFTDQIDYINIAKGFVSLHDFQGLSRRLIYPPNSHGKLGGKSAGMFLARKIVERMEGDYPELAGIKVPRTWHISSDGSIAFLRHNSLEDVYDRKYLELEEVRQQYPYVIQVFKSSPFPPEILNGLSIALEDLGDRPLVVRSSSLLEDRTGAAFSGKYKSLFLANQGTKGERLAALLDAVAEVYASIFGPDPIEYRAERNLLDVHEEMGIMIQEVVGTRVGKYFFPAFSGVAFSNNEFRWSPRIKREDGLIRLVPGLGTRAVDRLGDDFPVLLAPGQPGLRVNTTPDEILRYSPKQVDLIDLETGSFESVHLTELLKTCGNDIPLGRQILSVVEHQEIRRPGFRTDLSKSDAVVTFEGLASSTPFLSQMATVLKVLRETMGTPVDVEFASDGTDLFLLQCRSQSYTEGSAPAPIPRDIPRNRILFTAHRYISNGRIPDITHVVYVDPEAYVSLPDLSDLKDVGKAVSRLNKLLPKRQFILMGPGRWGSRGDVRLGVPVTYSDINNTALLVEIAHQTGKYSPDLSFGTHFFQDLVEAHIRYLPLYPGEDENILNDLFFRRGENLLPELVPEFSHLSDTVKVLDVARESEGQVLRVLMNAELGEAVALLAEPGMSVDFHGPSIFPRGRLVAAESAPDDHWQWRLRMAEKLARKIDPQRFSVKGIWVFGSTKNATAGPGSDIDLLIHFDGTEEEREELLLWLEGWSLALEEINYIRTGYRSDGLLDVRLISDRDIENRTSYTVKIGAVTDPARPLAMGTASETPV
ncbi:MAG: PEP/pyruvate-binding domain-containing protein [Longimicrobiales bacterium]